MNKPNVKSKRFEKIYNKTHAEVFGLVPENNKKGKKVEVPVYKSIQSNYVQNKKNSR